MSSIEKAIEKANAEKKKQHLEQQRRDIPSREGYAEPDTHSPVGLETPGSLTDRYEALNFSMLKLAGYLTPEDNNSLLAEEFRRIKRPILQNAFGAPAQIVQNGNLVMVTSAVPGEGKTFTAINLAISIAMELEKTVMLIDGDSVMSSVSRVLGLSSGLGLSDILKNSNMRLNDVLISTNVPKLSILSAGSNKQHVTELFSSDSMLNLVSDLSHRYSDRIIIFDSPPLTASSEARVLADIVGQILVVVEANRTSQSLVQDALNSLDDSKAIGLILNKCLKSDVKNYGYGYGYR